MRETQKSPLNGKLPACLEQLQKAVDTNDAEEVRALLFGMVETYNP
jgi:hypothetical protein